jgi:hypothetical protein
MASAKPAVTREEIRSVWTRDEPMGAGVSWPAVFAGAFSIGASGLILMVLGAGFGLSSVSPWPESGADASRISTGAVIWVIFVQLAASTLGGYLAGRLRTKWVALHTHEVFFRDTAHGFIAWCVALVLTTILFAGYAVSLTPRPVNAQTDQSSNYFVGRLFFAAHPGAADQNIRNDAGAVLANALRHPDTAAQDQGYLTDMVVMATGLSRSEAERRVIATVTADREAADAARKSVAHSLYWLFVAFLIGAFCASYAATIGGRQRDSVPVTR